VTLPADPPLTDDAEPPPADRTGAVGRLTKFSGVIAGAAGWRGALLTVALGAIAASALPPIHILPALLAFTALAWRLEGGFSPFRSAWTGWLFGFGYHILGLYWISNALLVESDRFAVFVPLAVIGLPMLLALFPAVMMGVVPLISRPGWSRALAVAALWSVAEYARGHLFTGFPWNLPAYTVSFSDTLSQAASWLGAYGLTLVVLVVAVGPAIAWGPNRPCRRLTGAVACMSLVIGLLLWGGGAARLSGVDLAVHSLVGLGPGSSLGSNIRKPVVIRLVQGNIPQKDKWKPALRDRHLSHYLALSRQSVPTTKAADLPSRATPTVIIWPETAVPGFLGQSPELRHALAGAVPAGGSLVTGAPSTENFTMRRVYNSLIALGQDATVHARYDKVHLVPFGEYVPLRGWLPLPRVARSFVDFTPGPGRRAILIDGLGLISPLICYEIIFPNQVISGGERPKALLNLTNDAWYGRSSGPYQHLAISRMRAIEEGIPLIRVANTGISGIYDAYGRATVQIGLDKTGVADGFLPLSTKLPTIYGRFGNQLYWVLFIFLCLSVLIARGFLVNKY
jgi:apolipoprotein N-acyltransferase